MNDNVSTLYALAHELLYLGTDGKPIYSDDFTRLNREVYQLANELYSCCGATPEEEAKLCLSLLMAYNATAYDNGDKQEHIQGVLDRCWEVLDKLSPSLLKVQLLTYCHEAVYEKELADQAYSIIDTWDKAALTSEQMEAVEELENTINYKYTYKIVKK
ncbi:UpxZ family transcription anti-terminator antagonist [Bacteroides sp. GD17]|jgi:hypothetical protein|uniref:UpxZ family transcription anti-terminator antagonist n=1 Tax=Bacteroides sp. GD17 TaxID=3139826 RepID=UPI00313B37D2